VLTMVPVGMTWLFGNLAGAVKRQGHLNWFIVCITVGNLILNWLLIARHGVMGAAVTTLVSELAMAASAAWVVRDYVDLREFVKAFTGVFVPAGMVFVAGKLHVFPGAFPMQLSLTLLCLSAGFLVSGAVRIKDVRRFMNV
jgi:O-antigen/teichoic acid export membrane protein